MIIAAIVLLALLGQQDNLTTTVPGKAGHPPVTVTCQRLNPETVIYQGSDAAVGFGTTCAEAVADWKTTVPPKPFILHTA